MKATEARLLDFLKKSPQFVIPIYQRTYTWTERMSAVMGRHRPHRQQSNASLMHFVGSIVYIEFGLSQVTHQSPLLVIDGQQRLTTVTLLLPRSAKALGETEPLDGFSPRSFAITTCSTHEETGERHLQTDLVADRQEIPHGHYWRAAKPKEHSLRVNNNFEFFEER